MASIGTLYGASWQAKTVRVLALAKYIGVQLELKDLTLSEGEHRKPEFTSKFPYAKIPAFEGSDGFILSESRAIERYIAGLGQNQNLLGSDAKSAAEITQWENFADDELFNNGATIRRPNMGIVPYFKPIEQIAFDNLDKALTYLDKHLQDKTFLVGHRITLADIVVASNVRSLYIGALGPEIRSKYPNVLRFLNTVVNQEGFGGVLTKDFTLASETFKYIPPKKEEKPKAAAAPAAAPAPKKEKKPAAKDDDDDEPLVPAEPKQKNPLDDLPKSPFILDEWKRQYSNKDTRGEALPWFWQNFDAEGWSLWKFDFKYNEELTQIFMSANQIGGFFNRLEASRKYVFGTAGVFGEANNSVISGVALCRGKDWKPVLGVAPDIDSYSVTPLDHTKDADRKLWDDYLAWEASVDGKAWADGKVLK
ncbi:hypothetical protein OC835_003534 [Tilletia horrida]|uniref:Elongation factor 1-gamma n=1 Tax=Tilletia horrida TaxID=155126 RepID=A0AAN6G537_9BASI|nr:hypothetical protein OC842_006650 [Tilletia horrida]KAK0531852.1 hypothetical protein OC835_003534 [Tilletia horrida]